jgi:hypothetical protein
VRHGVRLAWPGSGPCAHLSCHIEVGVHVRGDTLGLVQTTWGIYANLLREVRMPQRRFGHERADACLSGPGFLVPSGPAGNLFGYVCGRRGSIG